MSGFHLRNASSGIWLLDGWVLLGECWRGLGHSGPRHGCESRLHSGTDSEGRGGEGLLFRRTYFNITTVWWIQLVNTSAQGAGGWRSRASPSATTLTTQCSSQYSLALFFPKTPPGSPLSKRPGSTTPHFWQISWITNSLSSETGWVSAWPVRRVCPPRSSDSILQWASGVPTFCYLRCLSCQYFSSRWILISLCTGWEFVSLQSFSARSPSFCSELQLFDFYLFQLICANFVFFSCSSCRISSISFLLISSLKRFSYLSPCWRLSSWSDRTPYFPQMICVSDFLLQSDTLSSKAQPYRSPGSLEGDF